mmetsp:Transcript_89301/g.161158  ORF Transcript_89301/g.161158 Transcript_89301/m.161158 type:complete len:203 (-) Transcript_89301:1323-1931(-)
MLGPLHLGVPGRDAGEISGRCEADGRPRTGGAADLGYLLLRASAAPASDPASLRAGPHGDDLHSGLPGVGQDGDRRHGGRAHGDLGEAPVDCGLRRAVPAARVPGFGAHERAQDEPRGVGASGRGGRYRALELPLPQRLQPDDRGHLLRQRHRDQGLGVLCVVRRLPGPRYPRLFGSCGRAPRPGPAGHGLLGDRGCHRGAY